MPSRSEHIRTYLRAKDQNRPHLTKFVFAETAKLEMNVDTGTISFPPLTNGVDAITKVLVRDFGQVYENVYTFCLADPPKGDTGKYRCPWLVGMSEKASGSVRVGCGHYDWSFETSEPYLVDGLTISIKMMEVLPSEYLHPVMGWVSELPYPWCPSSEAIEGMPDVAALEEVRKFIHQSRD
jgi:hypothetical protein